MTVQAPAGLAPRPDVRLVRIKLEATTPSRALSAALFRFGPRLAALVDGGQLSAADAPLETVLNTERKLVERAVVVPVVHIRELYALGDRVESWNGPVVLGSGAWNLSNAWIRAERAANTGRPRE